MDWQDPPAKVKYYVAAVVVAAVPVYIWSILDLIQIASTRTWDTWFSLIGITAVACVSSRWVVRIPRTITWIAVGDCLILSVTLIYGVSAGVLANGVTHLVSYWFATRGKPVEHRGETLKWSIWPAVFNTSAFGLYAFLSGIVYFAVLPEGRVDAHWVILPGVLLAATYFLVNSASMHAVQALAGQASFRSLWRQDVPLLPLYYLASASGAAIIYFFHQVAGSWAFLLALPILLVVYYAHLFYNEKYDEILRLNYQTVEAFAFSIDALELHTPKARHTNVHLKRTREATLMLAKALGVDDDTYAGLRFASVLHDVGKISIPSYILHKPTSLNERELQKVRTHAEVGADILSSINFSEQVIPMVKHHHENWDGSGYPEGLKGEEIPLGSRILAVADCYEALTHERIYRPAFEREIAISIMKRESHRFDPRIFKKFLDIEDQVHPALKRLEVPQLKDPTEPGENERRKGLPEKATQPSPLFSSISEPQREVFTLFEILQTIGNSLSRTDTLTIIATKIEKIIPFDTLVIYLVDESSGVLTPAYTAGKNKEAFQAITIDFGARLAGWVAANNRMLYNVHPGPETMLLPQEVRNDYQNSIFAPLVHEERRLGTIALYEVGTGGYSNDNIRLMEIIANRASTALYNAIRFEETQEDAFTDRLTGLANSRFLYIFFEQTLSEAKRYQEPLTVIEMDLDDFKNVNDRYGHYCGDRFLKEVGSILKSQMRESDVLVRYAGDEFIAVLPKTPIDQARLFSYRLQDAVETAQIDVGIGKMLSVGISQGLASYPTNGVDLESLMISADKNMYENKTRRKGRRRKIGEIETDAHQPSLFEAEESFGPRMR